MPIRWASARAPTTAWGEQQLFSPSVAGSAQSSSVTATTSSPASSASCAAAALSTPPLIATSVRRGLGASAGAPSRRGRAQRAVQRVGRQLGGVALGGQEPAEGSGHLVRPDARGVQHRRALHELDRGACGRAGGGAARRLEAGLGHPVAHHADRQLHQVAAGRSAGRALMRGARERALTVRVL